jgi:hypothetical protein
MHHDADEAVVLVEPQFQHWQAGLQRDRERDAVADLEPARAAELLAVEKQARQAAQALPLLGRTRRTKGRRAGPCSIVVADRAPFERALLRCCLRAPTSA